MSEEPAGDPLPKTMIAPFARIGVHHPYILILSVMMSASSFLCGFAIATRMNLSLAGTMLAVFGSYVTASLVPMAFYLLNFQCTLSRAEIVILRRVILGWIVFVSGWFVLFADRSTPLDVRKHVLLLFLLPFSTIPLNFALVVPVWMLKCRRCFADEGKAS